MKKIKRLILIGLVLILTASLTGCAVPYTYITIASNYIKEHKEAFSDQMDAFYASFEGNIPENLKGTVFERLLYEMTGADSYTSENPEEEKEQKPPKQSSEEKKKKTAEKEKETSAKEDESSETEETSSENQEEELQSEAASDSNESSFSEKENEPAASGEKKIQSPYIPDYIHYEYEDYKILCDAFVEAGDADDSKEIEKTYQKLVDDLKLIATMDTVAFLSFSVDVNDSYYDEEYAYCEKIYTDCYDLFMTACHDVLDSKGADAFEKIANENVLEEARDYEPLTEHTKELLDQEIKLENEYDKKLDQIGELTYELNGKTYTLDQIYEEDSDLAMLAVFHYNDFIRIYEGLVKKANESLGPIYLELLDIRAQLADEFGYDSYAQYCYENIYGREYTTEDAAKYCEVIKENISGDFYDNCYYYLYNSSYFETDIPQESRLRYLKEFASDFGSIMEEAYEAFAGKELFNIGNEKGRYEGSYTTSIYSERLPFIFANIEDYIDGLSTLDHEFGHFINDYYEESKDPEYFFISGNYDVFEIHSNAFQLICSNHYGDILPASEAEKAQEYDLAMQLYCIVEGCVYDEFQRRVYENTDLTLDEVNQIYEEVCRDYGMTSLPGDQYMWVMVNHNFESPMYYISYSISSLSALEIWMTSLGDEKEAIDTWVKIVKEEDDEAYETVMENVGLTPFTDSNEVVEICRYAMDYMNGEMETGGIAA